MRRHRDGVVRAPRSSGVIVCVGGKRPCFRSIQEAVDAAQDGDTIRIGAGTFAGGITITKSLALVGAGAASTVIRGGGPVLTIGEYLGVTEPTVSISGVTVTGGMTTSSPLSDDWVGAPDVIALGGGVFVPPSADYGEGATVSISDTVITGNQVGPTAAVPFGPPCPGGPCSFAWARGGGIDTWGALTLRDTVVSDNEASGTASDANGGGISLWAAASLTMRSTSMSGNRALAKVPDGRYAEGGAIFGSEGVTVRIADSLLSGNRAALESVLPYDVGGGDVLDMNANGGAIHLGDGSTIELKGSRFESNVVSVDDLNGEPAAFDSAVNPGNSELAIRDSSFRDNRVLADLGSSEHVGPSGGVMDFLSAVDVRDSRFIANTTVVRSAQGLASTTATIYAASEQGTAGLRNSLIAGNTVEAVSGTGEVLILGVGVTNEGALMLRDVRVADNMGRASGTGGSAQGGGIWNGQVFEELEPALILDDTAVTGNALVATPGIDVLGGGIFTNFPVTLTDTTVKGNIPDQCYGC